MFWYLLLWWDDNLVWYFDYFIGVGFVIVGCYIGVCFEGKVRFIGIDVFYRWWDEGMDLFVWVWMFIDVLIMMLGWVKFNGCGIKLVINMLFSMIVFNELMCNMLSMLF